MLSNGKSPRSHDKRSASPDLTTDALRKFPKTEIDMVPDDAKLQAFISQCDTEELIDRVTAYRSGMEPLAIESIERELHKRGITAAQIADYREKCLRTCLFLPDGTAKMCSFCRSPAIKEGWGWHRVLGKVPIFPRPMRSCEKHVTKLN